MAELFGWMSNELDPVWGAGAETRPGSKTRAAQEEKLRAQVTTWLDTLEEPRRTAMATKLAHEFVRLGNLGWAVLGCARLGVEKARALEVASEAFDGNVTEKEQAKKIAQEADACLEAEAQRGGADVVQIARHLARIHLITGLGAMRIVRSIRAIDDTRTRFAVEATAAATSFERMDWEGTWVGGKQEDWQSCEENVDSNDIEELWLRITTRTQDTEDEAMLARSIGPLTETVKAGEPIARRCARLVEVGRERRRNSAPLEEALEGLRKAQAIWKTEIEREED